MRVAVAALLLLAGCVGAPAELPPEGNASAAAPQPTGLPPEPAAPPPLGERSPAGMEPFVLRADRTIAFRARDEPLAEERVPETLSGAAFYTAQTQPIAFSPFVSAPFNVPFETTAEFDITLRFVSSAPAVSTVPSASGFPAIGGWFGTPERYAFFVGAPDLPPTLEADTVYTATLRVPAPPGGFFVRQGEPISLALFANYQPADGSTIAWVVGGAEPAGFALPHSHFNVSAPRAIVLVDGSGETGPNPAPTGDQNPQPASVAFQVPPEALYVVLEVDGAPKAGASIDIDASIRTRAGEVLAAGTSPYAREVAVVGPSALAVAGRDLVAFVTSASSASGGTFQLKVTAYAPAAGP